MSSDRLRPAARSLYRSLPSGWAAGVDFYLQHRYSRNRAPTRLDVMTSFAGRDLDVMQVLLLSLSETHPQDEIVFWLLHLDIAAPDLAALADYCATLGNISLRPIKVEDSSPFQRLKTLGGKPDGARFLWLTAHQHLPADLHRVIYLDALDIIVTDDLVPLLNHPFLGRYVVACREVLDTPPMLVGPADRSRRLGAGSSMLHRMSRGLVNSGAIVINLDKFRRDGIGIARYVAVAEWASQTMKLGFGDQGLFSLTHGSHYARAHDRYNHRFYNEPSDRIMARPAVIHYAGQVLKPARWRMTPAQEDAVADHLRRTGQGQLALDKIRRLRVSHFPYFHRWWQVCARTPCHDRIAPIASERMTAALAKLGLG